MARVKDREKAIQLRFEGKSYSQIKAAIGVNKSTLSGWLKDMPLSSQQFHDLGVIERRVESYKETCRKRKEKILKSIYDEEEKNILPLSKRDLFIAGLFLYWGEGGKTSQGSLTLSNTNPGMIRFFIYWAINSCNISKDKIKIRMHLYRDMDIEEETEFWIKHIGVQREQFSKPYIKDSNKSGITYKTGFGHGTCNVYIGSAILAKKVLMGLKVLENSF